MAVVSFVLAARKGAVCAINMDKLFAFEAELASGVVDLETSISAQLDFYSCANEEENEGNEGGSLPENEILYEDFAYRPPTDEEDPAEAAKRAEEVEAIRKEVEENFRWCQEKTKKRKAWMKAVWEADGGIPRYSEAKTIDEAVAALRKELGPSLSSLADVPLEEIEEKYNALCEEAEKHWEKKLAEDDEWTEKKEKVKGRGS